MSRWKFVVALLACLSLSSLVARAAVTKQQFDVTKKVAAAVRDNSLSIEVNNDNFGDPADGVVKQLRVRWSVGDLNYVRTLNENETLEIAKPAGGQKLEIVEAIYGAFPHK